MKENYFGILNNENLGKVSTVVDKSRNVYYKLEDVWNVLGTEDREGDIERLKEIGRTLGTEAVVNLEQGVQVLAHKDGTEMDGSRYGWYVTETGLYFLIMQAKSPAALKFSAWLAGEVLIRLREKSKYEMGEENC